jgi:hypothetical protein
MIAVANSGSGLASADGSEDPFVARFAADCSLLFMMRTSSRMGFVSVAKQPQCEEEGYDAVGDKYDQLG